jgi:hypothetical protein
VLVSKRNCACSSPTGDVGPGVRAVVRCARTVVAVLVVVVDIDGAGVDVDVKIEEALRRRRCFCQAGSGRWQERWVQLQCRLTCRKVVMGEYGEVICRAGMGW